METIEIRQNRKTLIPILVLLTAGLIGGTYYIFFWGKFDTSINMKIIYVSLTASLIYTIYIPARKFFKNEPVLSLNNSGIIINEKGTPVSFLWVQIIHWKIEKEEDGGTYYLIIETVDKKRKINISWLDKWPAEIEELIRAYKNWQTSTATNII
jgi:hypothetical protein